MAVDVDNLLARIAETLGAAKAVGESTDAVLHPDAEKPAARWMRRRAWGQPKLRQRPGRQKDAKGRPAPRCRRLPGRRRIRRVRRFTGPSGHRRRSDGELRKLLARGAFAGWMEDNVRAALDSPERAVIVCASPSCSGMSMVQRDKAAETWAKHCRTHVHEHGKRRERLTVPGLSGSKRHRRRMLRRVRRTLAANVSRGLLGEVRAHAEKRGWDHAALDRVEMTAITANTGSNNWNTNGAWVGGVQPTAADDVTLPASAVVTIPTATTALCRSINVQASATIAFATTTAVLTIGDASGGAATFSSTCTVTLTGIGTINFVAAQSATTFSLTTGGKVMPNLTVNTSGATASTIQFADAVTATGATITLTKGKLDTNSKTVTAAAFSSSNGNTRTLTLGTTSFSVSQTGGAAWDLSTPTNMTLSGGSSTVTLTGAVPGMNWGSSASLAYGTVVFSGFTGNVAWNNMGAGTTVVNVTVTGPANKTSTVSSSSASSMTISGTLTLNGNSITNRVLIQSNTLGTTRTIVLGGSATARTNSSNVDFSDITMSGGAANERDFSAISGKSGDALGNTGITFTTPQTNYYKAAALDNFSTTAKWFLATNGAGGAGRVPLPQDTAIFDGNSGAFTYTMDVPRFGTVTATGFTGTFAFSSVATTTFGNLTMGLATVVSGTQRSSLGGRGSQTITSSGRTFTQAFTLANPSGSYILQDAFVTSISAAGALNLTATSGTFSANNFTATVSGSANTVTVAGGTLTMGSGAWTTNATAAGTFWSVTGGTITATASTLSLASATSNSRTFAGGGKTYGTLSYTVAASTGALVVTGANTFAALTVTSEAGNAKTLTLPSATTSTVTTLTLAGVSGSLLTLNSSTPASAATISSGGTVSAQYLSLTDQATSGTSSPFHAVNSTIGSNVTGWIGDGTLTGVTTTLTLASPTGAAKGGATATGVASALSLAAPTGTAKGAARVLGVATAVSFAAPVGGVKGSSTDSGAVATLTLASPAGTGTGSATAAGAAATLTFVAAPGATTGTAGVTGVSTTLTLTAFAGTAAGAAALAGATSTLALGAPPGTATGALDANVIGITVTLTLAAPGGEVRNTVAFRVGTMSTGWSAGQVGSGWSAGPTASGWTAGAAESDWTTGQVGSGWRSRRPRL